jgi:hypothetical protein
MSMAIDAFGAALEAALADKYMSLEELATVTGIPLAMLRLHLAGKHRPHELRIDRIEAALNLAPGTLGDIPLPSKEYKRPF